LLTVRLGHVGAFVARNGIKGMLDAEDLVVAYSWVTRILRKATLKKCEEGVGIARRKMAR